MTGTIYFAEGCLRLAVYSELQHWGKKILPSPSRLNCWPGSHHRTVVPVGLNCGLFPKQPPNSPESGQALVAT